MLNLERTSEVDVHIDFILCIGVDVNIGVDGVNVVNAYINNDVDLNVCTSVNVVVNVDVYIVI